MRGADHTRAGIDEKNRSAIGRRDADGERFGAGNDRVGLRPRSAVPRPVRHHDVGRMGLVEGEQALGRNAHPFGHAAAVFRNLAGIVVRSGAAVEAFVNPAGDAAFAGEKGVAQAGNGREQRRTQHHGVSAFASGLSSESPASATRSGCEIASTLNIEPIPPRPVSISRFSAPEISAETSWLAFAISVTARVSMPSRFRKSPCVPGPCTRAPTPSAARAKAWKSTWAVTSAWPGFFRGSVKLWRAIA